MLDPVVEKRLPVLILLGCIVVVSLIDWQRDLGAWMMRPVEVAGAWEQVREGNFSSGVWQSLATTVTAAFLHGGLGHLSGNLLFLWIFGVVVCELCGWRWMVAVFVVTAVGGSLGQILLDPGSAAPVLGASGGLMGMEGFYFGLAFLRPRPEAHVWPIARPVGSAQLAAVGVLGIAFDFMGIMGGGQGIAYGAHLGGFASGIILSTLADRMVS